MTFQAIVVDVENVMWRIGVAANRLEGVMHILKEENT